MKYRRTQYNARQRAQRVMQRKRIIQFAGMSIVAIGVIYLSQSGVNRLFDASTFPIQTVVIEGNFKHVEAGSIRSIVQPYIESGFFGADVDEVKLALQDMPWLYKANVRRMWPDELHITVYEQTALARWGDDGLLNHENILFRPGDMDGVDGLPRLQGPPETEDTVMASYRAMNDLLMPHGLVISALSLDERRAWHVTLDNGVRLALGRHSAMERLQRFIQVYPDVLAGKTQYIEEIDLRYSNGFVVRWNVPQEKALGKGLG